jgi:hypothetical protein
MAVICSQLLSLLGPDIAAFSSPDPGANRSEGSLTALSTECCAPPLASTVLPRVVETDPAGDDGRIEIEAPLPMNFPKSWHSRTRLLERAGARRRSRVGPSKSRMPLSCRISTWRCHGKMCEAHNSIVDHRALKHHPAVDAGIMSSREKRWPRSDRTGRGQRG